MFSFSPSLTVLDCGASRVACGRFTARGGRLRLESFAWEPLDQTGNWLGATAAAFARLAKRAPVAGPVALVLPGHLVLTKFLKTPRVEAAKREKVVCFEAQQNIPYALPEVVWGHAVTSESERECDVMLCAAKHDALDALCAAAERAGFHPRALLPGVCAFRAAAGAHAAVEPTLFINLGARTATLLLVEERRVHARTAALGGPAVSADGDCAPETVATFATRLGHEVTRSAVHFKRTAGAATPARVLLCGGASRAPELASALAARLHVPVDRFDPLAGVEIAQSAAGDAGLERWAAHLADLIGAARAGFASARSAINLLPPRLLARENSRRRMPWIAAAAVLTATAFVPVLDYHREREAALDRQAAAIDAEIAPLRLREAQNRANLERLAALQQQLATLHAIAARRTNWQQLFADLEGRFVNVEDVWLDRLQLAAIPADANAPLRLVVSGRMLDRTNPLASVSADAHRRVTELLASVARSPYVSSVERERFDQRQPGLLHFEVVLVSDPARPL